MSRERFEEDCADCRPVIFNPDTGVKYGPETPEGKAVAGVWAGTKRRERVAFHNATCKNSREGRDMKLMKALMDKIGAAIKKAKEESAHGP